MVHLRATQKVLRRLARDRSVDRASDCALGDWFVNRVVVARQPLLIMVSSSSLLAVLEPARDVRSLPERLPEIVGRRLKRLGVETRHFHIHPNQYAIRTLHKRLLMAIGLVLGCIPLWGALLIDAALP